MNTSLPNADILRLAEGFLKQSTPIPWIDWLPLAELAAEAPENWITAFDGLRDEKQYELLNLLRDEVSGPLAESLILLLAASPLEISDEQVRQFTMEFAEQSHERRLKRIEQLRDNIPPLSEKVNFSHKRLKEGFDISLEIIRLEKELAEIRTRETGQDERFAQIHNLEHEIFRMETRKRILDKYDSAARSLYHQELQKSIRERAKEKDDLEKKIATFLTELEDIKKEVAQKEAKQANLQVEIDLKIKQHTEISKNNDLLMDENKSLKVGIVNLEEEEALLKNEIKQQTKTNTSIRAHIENAKATLQELQKEAQKAGMSEVHERIQEAYALLPLDLADEACK